MRRLRATGLGLSFVLSAPAAFGQGGPPPAATLGRVQFTEPAEPTSRAQFAPAPIPRFDAPAPRYPARQAPAGTPLPPGGLQPGETLPQPRPLPNPKVGEERTPVPGVGQPYYPAPGVGQPYPPPVPYAQPVPHGQPVGPYTGVPLTPVYGGVGAPPAVYGPDASIPVSPGVPGYGADGFSAGPIMDDPYLGGGGYGYFPRARQILGTAGGGGTGRFQISSDYLLWFVRAGTAPALITTGPAASNGIIGQPGTRVLLGGEDQVLNNTRHSGARFNAVYYLPGNKWGVDGSLFFLGRNGGTFSTTTDENPVIARPFTNLNTGQSFSEVIGSPGLATGSAIVNYGTSMWGADVSLRRGLYCTPCSRLDFLLGFKFANLSEDIEINEQFIRTPTSNLQVGVPTAAGGLIQDRFETVNNFYGVQLGLAGEIRRGRWYANGRAVVGLGTMYQTANISGSQRIITADGGLTTASSGLLAIQGANTGSFTRATLGVVPEVGFTLGYYLTPRLRVGVGYGFVYMNSVLRPGNVIDTGLDVTKIPNFPLNPAPGALAGQNRPQVVLRQSDFFAQGITFSLQWTW